MRIFSLIIIIFTSQLYAESTFNIAEVGHSFKSREGLRLFIVIKKIVDVNDLKRQYVKLEIANKQDANFPIELLNVFEPNEVYKKLKHRSFIE